MSYIMDNPLEEYYERVKNISTPIFNTLVEYFKNTWVFRVTILLIIVISTIFKIGVVYDYFICLKNEGGILYGYNLYLLFSSILGLFLRIAIF